MKGRIIVVCGGQFGSEAKGKYIQDLTDQRLSGKIDIAVRTGAPNAGHTINVAGEWVAMQQIPCSFTDKECILVLGAGALIHEEIFKKEYDLVQKYTPGRKIYVDHRATLLDEECVKAERGMHARIGSTAEGCGEALIRKIRRDESIEPAMNAIGGYEHVEIVDTVRMLNEGYDNGKTILLEGTQGAHLSLVTGIAPYTTSRDTNAANWMMEVGLSPALKVEVHLVFRTYPIRVAGTSGPFNNEITWPQFLIDSDAPIGNEMLEELNHAMNIASEKVKTGVIIPNDLMLEAVANLSESTQTALAPYMEKTTVTKKYRRIARFSEEDAAYSCMINRPAQIALQFVNYTDRNSCKKLLDEGMPSFSYKNVAWIDNKFPKTQPIVKFLRKFAPVKYFGLSKESAAYVK